MADEAVLTFTRTFYSKLWRERSKICHCFNAAKLAVEIHHGKEEASCFVKFTKESKTHQCYIYGNFQVGTPRFESDESLFWDKSPDVCSFLGYETLRQDLIHEFFSRTSQSRFIRITGQAGTGKSALARHTLNYV